MEKDILKVMLNLFEGKKIRSIWDSEKEDYYFSVVDVINVLAEPKDPSDYWTTLKRRFYDEEGSQLPTNCRRLKLKAKVAKDDLERKLGKKVITKQNNLNYQYLDDMQLETK